MKNNPLVIVKLGPNRWAKVYESDAIARGLPYEKERRKGVNKQRVPLKNKAEEFPPLPLATSSIVAPEKTVVEKPSDPDNFSMIPGIGPSTTELLYSQGVMTFGDLEELDLEEAEWLNARAISAILEWKKGRAE